MKRSGRRKRRRELGEYEHSGREYATGPWLPPGPNSGELFGVMDRPFKFKEHRLEFRDGRYRRWVGETLATELLIRKGTVGAFPVSPLHTPSILGKHIMAEFSSPVLVSPRSEMALYASLPVEVGVFVRDGEHYETVDVFSLTTQKYALYGSPNEGFICRWASVTPSPDPPASVRFPEEAVIRFIFRNTMNRWSKLDKAVFPGEMARIFYGNGAMSFPVVEIDIVNKGITRAKIDDRPYAKGMHPGPLSTMHTAPIRLKELSIFKPESTLMVGGD
jgi:hypothetical protein